MTAGDTLTVRDENMAIRRLIGKIKEKYPAKSIKEIVHESIYFRWETSLQDEETMELHKQYIELMEVRFIDKLSTMKAKRMFTYYNFCSRIFRMLERPVIEERVIKEHIKEITKKYYNSPEGKKWKKISKITIPQLKTMRKQILERRRTFNSTVETKMDLLEFKKRTIERRGRQ